jgi:hypothetical protein
MKKKRRVNGTGLTEPMPPRSGLVQLLSELLALPAGYSGTRNLRRAKSAAISASRPFLVKFSFRQTLPPEAGYPDISPQCSTVALIKSVTRSPFFD